MKQTPANQPRARGSSSERQPHRGAATAAVASPAPTPTRAAEPRRAIVLWLSLALLVITTAVYLPAGHFDFVNYDDPLYVRDNPHVQAGVSVNTFLWALTAFEAGNWHPLTLFSYVLDYQLFGLNPGPYHLVNIGLHVLNVLLLFWILTDLTRRMWPSAWVAGMFALHPLHVESVAWISERKDVLSTLFWLLTLWAYLLYVRQPGWRRYAVLLAVYIAALFSKPMVVTLPFVLLLLDLWPLNRLAAHGGNEPQDLARSAAVSPVRLVIEKLPLLLLAAIVMVLTVSAQSRIGALNSLGTRPLAERIANATFQYGAYLWKTLWPSGLAAFYPVEPLAWWQVLGSAMLLVVITAGVLWKARRYPYLLTGWLWYLGMLVPVIGLVAQGAQARADRFTYLPLVGVFIMVAWGVPDLLQRWRQRRTACAAAAIATLAVCAVLTSRQLSFWRDSVSLFEHALAVTHDNLLAYSLIGSLELAGGRSEAALQHLSEAARICDTSPGEQKVCTLAHYNTGLLLAKRGELDGAQQHYRQALRFDASYAKAHLGLGQVFAAHDDLDAAAASYRDALRLDPDLAAAHTRLALILERMGRLDDAIVHYADGVRLEPQDAGARCNLAGALANAGRFPEAIEQFRSALQLKPALIEARFGIATAYAHTGQTPAAIAALEDLLRDRPDDNTVAMTLAWLLATADDPPLRNGARAVQLSEAAAERTGHHDPDVLNVLAAAYAEAGRFTDAERTAEAALEAARAANRTALADAVTQRLALYRAGQPVRDRTGGAP